ncbi:MAG TPA: SDR family NAD(P)-dependent oxidoreductase [Candidatus Binataceae bacterium]|nr:SDR family NAD(P)-dependent oxidoreductase [Candidatus Binataceae bacterium]
MSDKLVCAIVGVGPGLGLALARRFAPDYSLALIARSEEFLSTAAREIRAQGGRAIAVGADLAAADQIERAFGRIRSEIGAPAVTIYNAAMRPFGRLMETTPEAFENSWRSTAFGAFLCSQQVVPEMLKAGRGAIVFTGATAGFKPFATSAAFGPAEFALRGLAQVMARDLAPSGIHVAYVNIDGPIDNQRTRARNPKLTDDDVLKPAAIAQAYWHLVHQDRSAWTQELELRPFREKF